MNCFQHHRYVYFKSQFCSRAEFTARKNSKIRIVAYQIEATSIFENVILKGIKKMPDFHKYVARHGEHGVQAIVERLERYDGIRHHVSVSLEDRWNFLMQQNAPQHRMAA